MDSSLSTTPTTAPAIVTTKPFPFLELAPELRHKVFDSYFQAHRFAIQCQFEQCESGQCGGGGRIDDDEAYGYDPYATHLAITRVSKLIRHESIAAMLRVSSFDFQLLDLHPTWTPAGLLQSYIGRMKNLTGPPRLLHYLGFTTMPSCSSVGRANGSGRWVKDCAAEHVVCDMIIDQFDILDALANKESNEGQYFEGLKTAIAGPKGAKLTLCVQVEDSAPTWSSWDESHIRSGFQVWKQKVIVRRKPRTEPGKVKMSNTLMLLGLKLKEKELHLLEPTKERSENAHEQAGDATDALTDGVEITTDISGAMGAADVSETNENVHIYDLNTTTNMTEDDDNDDDDALQWWNSGDDY